jgi:hypothetical protein
VVETVIFERHLQLPVSEATQISFDSFTALQDFAMEATHKRNSDAMTITLEPPAPTPFTF